MAPYLLNETKKLKTLKDTLLETIVLFYDTVSLTRADPTRRTWSKANRGTPIPMHLVGEIRDKSHDICWKIPEDITVVGGQILNNFQGQDLYYMTHLTCAQTGSLHYIDDYNSPVAKLNLARGEARNREAVCKIASLAHKVKEVEVAALPSELENCLTEIQPYGPLLKLRRLRASCDIRNLPFRFDHESLRVLEIRNNRGCLDEISKCTNLTRLWIDDMHKDTLNDLIVAITPLTKLRSLCLLSHSILVSFGEIHEMVECLPSLELLEVNHLKSSHSNLVEPKKKLKLLVYSVDDTEHIASKNDRLSILKQANNLALKVGSEDSLDGVLTKCEHTRSLHTFWSAYDFLLNSLNTGEFRVTSTEDIKRIERAAIAAAKINSKKGYVILNLANRIRFSEEFMLKLSCLYCRKFRLPVWSDPLDRFAEEFVRNNDGRQLAKALKKVKVFHAVDLKWMTPMW